MPTKIFPAYLFLGEEDFLKEEAIEKIKSGFLSAGTQGLNYSVFYARDKDFNLSEMLDSLNTLPFLSKKRLVVLKDADAVPADSRQAVISYLQGPRETSIFVIESPLPAIKGDFLLALSKCAQLVYYRRLTDSGLNTWLIKKAASSGKKIAGDAIDTIKENSTGGLRTLSFVMDNVILYTGKRQVVTKQDVEKLTGVSPSHTAFDLIASLEKKDAKKQRRLQTDADPEQEAADPEQESATLEAENDRQTPQE